MFLKSSALVFAVVVLAVSAANTKEEQQMISLINEIDSDASFPLFGGLSIERSGESGERSFGAAADEDLAGRAVRFLNTHTVKFNVPATENEGRQMEGENQWVKSRVKSEDVKLWKKVAKMFQ